MAHANQLQFWHELLRDRHQPLPEKEVVGALVWLREWETRLLGQAVSAAGELSLELMLPNDENMLDDVREELFARLVGPNQLEFRMVPHASHTFDLLRQLVEHEVDYVILHVDRNKASQVRRFEKGD